MAAIETGCPYVISAGGYVASFNVPSDPNFCGYVKEVTGLDMYGVRENAQVTSSGDGGFHGSFWRDRRPFTMSGFIMPTMPVSLRNVAQQRLQAVMGNCFRSDGILNWTPVGDGIQKGLLFRIQQPVRITTGQSNVEKNFALAGVCRDWRILTWAGSSAFGNMAVAVTNNGDADAAPKLTITGPITNPIITNTTSLKKLTINGTVADGQQLVIDLTGVYPTFTYNGADWSQYVDPLNTDYTIAAVPGTSNFQMNGTGTSGATALRVDWNDSWH